MEYAHDLPAMDWLSMRYVYKALDYYERVRFERLLRERSCGN
jgi:hypothetical protein